MMTATNPTRTAPRGGWRGLIAAVAAAQTQARQKRARAAQIGEDLESLVTAVSEAQDRRGPFDAHVVEGWTLVRQMEAQRTKLLAEAHALERLGLGARVRA